MLLSLLALAVPLIHALGSLPYLLPRNRTAGHRARPAVAAAGLAFVLSVVVAVAWAFGYSPSPSMALIDSVGVVLLLLISFLGLIIVRFSATALRDEEGGDRFVGWISLTLAAVLLLVQTGTLWLFALAWIATSLALRRLLLFYPGRPLAQKAARKKEVLAGAANLALVLAFALLWAEFGTDNIAALTAAAPGHGASGLVIAAAALLAVAAILKSAQFPFHGWLTQVMEAPTPVSALLHAGLINAGGFLLIRFSPVLVEVPGVLACLVAIGGFSALVGGLVMLTQPAIKTSLAWSTIAQMGFMVMQCGLGLFAFALLHIVAHSLYKAHAFLSSGQAVERVASLHRPGPVATPSLRAVGMSFLLALLVFCVIAGLLGAWTKPPQALALGMILIFGVAYMFAQGLADAAPRALMLRTFVYAGAMTVSYFLLQEASVAIVGAAVPPVPAPSPLGWVLIVLALASFGATAFAQAMFPHWAGHPALAGLRVHLQNGLYADLLVERALAPLMTVKEAKP